jgi:phosphoribosylformylglycinamidine synthase II
VAARARAADRPRPWEAVGLTAAEYRDIVRRLGREPTTVELGMFGAMWSEHCSYKSSRVHLRRLPTRGERVLVGPGENAGVLDLGGGYAVALRVESHNHPSAVEPFQGAATGVGGILRDVFTMGARPVALLDGLRFGPLEEPRNRYLAAGVTRGIAHYGNATGVPTVGGETTFDPAYTDNPLVNVMCVGFLRREHLQRGAAPGPGNAVYLVGNRTGRDGIHGASLLASRAFEAAAAELRPAVQVGDPFVGKLLMEACLELAASGVLRGLNDLGAAGITSAAAETAARAGTGVVLDLERVPCREEGMTPYEILLSESQERMLLTVAPEDAPRVEEVCRRWGLQAARIGTVTGDGRLRVRLHGEVVADVPVRDLTAGAPRYRRPARLPRPPVPWRPGPRHRDLRPGEAAGALLALLGRPSLASKRWLYRQYDHQVQTNTVVPPGAGDAAVLRHRPTGQGIALALDMGGRLCALDPFGGAALVVAEAARNVACAGARPIGLTNCLNFASPEHPPTMGAFVRTVQGLAAACRRLGIPVTGGNVSFYNETAGRRIHPTPAVGMLGVLPDAARARGSGATAPDHAVCVLGPLGRARLDGSEYQAMRWGLVRGAPLRPQWRVEAALLDVLAEFAGLASAHDAAEGGLAVALAEVVLTGRAGLEADLPAPRGRGQAARLDNLLFGEGPGRVVVTLPAERVPALQAECAARGLPCRQVGRTTEELRLRLRVGGRLLADLGPEELAVWEEALPRWLR